MTTPSSAMRYGIAVPQVFPGARAVRAEVQRHVEEAEELGFASLWVSELVQAQILDPLAMLNFAAARTERIGLGVAVILLPFRVPLQLARDLASLDRLSGGRLIVGFGLGSARKVAMFGQYGLSPERRVRRFTEALELLKRLWTEDSVTFHDDWWDIEDLRTLTPPEQRPHPPILFGAHRGPALRRAARLADGWIGSGSTSSDEFFEGLADIADHLAEIGRDPATFQLSKRVFVAVSDDAERDMARARSWFAANYGKAEMADKVMLVGDADHCAEHLGRFAAAGVDEVVLNPVFDEREQMERLAGEVIPRVGSHVGVSAGDHRS